MRARGILSLSNFFAVAHFYLITYILTPFLATRVSAETAALAVALGAIITLSIFPYIPRIVVRHGPQRVAIICAGLAGIVLALLATQPSALVSILLVALACAIPPFIVYQLDLMLEAGVEDEGSTGRIRTGFTTTGNVALIASPLLVGTLLGTTNRYSIVFIAAAISILPFILLMFTRTLPKIHPPSLRSIRTAGIALLSDADERAVAISNFVLQFFFRIIPLYVTLYFHTVLAIPWSKLGLMLGISLLPFALLEYPAGWLADTKFGDRSLLAIGYVIAGLGLSCLAFVNATTPLWVIVGILFITHSGGALVEAMTEAHFFRRVSADDAEAVSIFRMMRPLGALVAPIIGTIFLSAVGYQGLFVLCGIGILIAGMWCAYIIQTRSGSGTLLVADSPAPIIRKMRS